MSKTEEGLYCLDYGLPKCPCFLLRTGKCPECSMLHGEQVCRCKWTGFCILLEAQWECDCALDGFSCSRARLESISPISRHASKVILKKKDLGPLDCHAGIGLLSLVSFDCMPSVLIPGLCSYVDDSGAIHLIVLNCYFRGRERLVPRLSDCSFIWSQEGVIGLSALHTKEVENWVAIGTDISQVSILPVLRWLRNERTQDSTNDNIHVLLSCNGPALRFVQKELRGLGVNSKVFSRKADMFLELTRLLNTDRVTCVYSACNVADHGQVVSTIRSAATVPLLMFFDLGMVHRAVRHLRGKVVRY